MTYRMIVTQENPRTGRSYREIVRHIAEDEVSDRRNAVRSRAAFGSVIGIKVVAER
jgi:hypothetical protein